jgi:hypothetical protein
LQLPPRQPLKSANANSESKNKELAGNRQILIITCYFLKKRFKMKKLFILIVIIFLSLTFIQSKADCPPGWTSHNFTYLFNCDDETCVITVYYCTIIQNGEYLVQLDYVIMSECNFDCVYADDFWDILNDKLLEDAIKDGTFPPCPNSAMIMKTEYAKCWKIRNVPYNPIGDEGGYVEIISCGLTGKCKCTYKVCTDFSVTPPENIKTLVNCEPEPTPACSGIEPQLPPVGKTWDEPWETNCYYIDCPGQ